MTRARTAPRTYSIAYPSGWVHVPARRPDTTQLRFVEADLQRAGHALSSAEREVLARALARARAADSESAVLDSFLPLGPLPGTNISCAIVVGTIPLDGPVNHDDVEQFLLSTIVSRNAEAIEAGRQPAVRWSESPVKADVNQGARLLGSRTAIVRIPGTTARLSTIKITVVSGDAEAVSGEDELKLALFVLFDSILASLEWRDGYEEPSEPEERA